MRLPKAPLHIRPLENWLPITLLSVYQQLSNATKCYRWLPTAASVTNIIILNAPNILTRRDVIIFQHGKTDEERKQLLNLYYDS